MQKIIDYLQPFKKFVFSILLTLHVFIIVWVSVAAVVKEFPNGDKISPENFKKTHALFNNYISLTRNDQAWGMFSTIPTFTDYNVKIEFTDINNKKYLFNPIIPGLKKMDTKLRHIVFFIRITTSHRQYLSAYLDNAAVEAVNQRFIKPREINLKIYEYRIRELEKIRKDAILDTLYILTNGPFKCKE
jgi:hypothetical protein